MKPTLEEAKHDLTVIQQEIIALEAILTNASELATHSDMSETWYKQVADRARSHLISGRALETCIKKDYNL